MICDLKSELKVQKHVKKFYKDVDGIILVYDITNRKSIESISKWL